MANSTKDIFRNNLKYYRTQQNLTQEELSELSGISSDYLSEIERGKKTPSFKRLDLIDLDGVLNTYTGGFDKDFIPPIKEGAKEFLKKLSENFELKLFTTRNKMLASKWLVENDIDKFFVDITNTKDLAWLYIDDRCLKFDGEFSSLEEQINNFKPWYK